MNIVFCARLFSTKVTLHWKNPVFCKSEATLEEQKKVALLIAARIELICHCAFWRASLGAID
jgi:hypothetical protein